MADERTTGYVAWGRWSRRGRWFKLCEAPTQQECFDRMLDVKGRGLDKLLLPIGRDPNAEKGTA